MPVYQHYTTKTFLLLRQQQRCKKPRKAAKSTNLCTLKAKELLKTHHLAVNMQLKTKKTVKTATLPSDITPTLPQPLHDSSSTVLQLFLEELLKNY